MIKKQICVILILLFLLVSLYSNSIVSETSNKNIIYVDDDGIADFSKIQDAINNSFDGDIIFVYNGVYFENLIINKSVIMNGEDKYNTIIDGQKKNDTITIISNSVKITNFTIKNSIYDINNGWWKAGIRILNSSIIIKDNIISDNRLGIFSKHNTNLTIENNIFLNDSILFYPYDTGYVKRPDLNKKHFIHNINNNTVNGKPLLYYVDQKDMDISSNFGQLIAVNCTNLSIRNVSINNADFMVLLVFCSFCTIENSNFIENDGVFTLLSSNNNYISNNTFTNRFHGLLLDYYSKNNNIIYNNFLENSYCGLICEYYSNNNIIYSNNFIENDFHNAFLIQSFSNKWDNNYWNDWIGLNNNFLSLFPKIIWGRILENFYYSLPLNFDFNPSKNPL